MADTCSTATLTTKATDVRATAVTVYFLPVETRVPLKFGGEVLTSVVCCRVRVEVRDRLGRAAEGWGETPLSVQWAWPSSLPYRERLATMQQCALTIGRLLADAGSFGHPLELGYDFQHAVMPRLLAQFSDGAAGAEFPYLAALICLSAFDQALHDAYGVLHEVDVYDAYNSDYMNRDLAHFLEPDADARVDFVSQYPADFLNPDPPETLPAWHLVGGLDPIGPGDLQPGATKDDGHPTLLDDWIRRDGLRCLKIKLCGTDEAGDYRRLRRVAETAIPLGVEHFSADFNCTVRDPQYVVRILDDLACDAPELYQRILYVEQPFPYDLKSNRIDVRSVADRKPIFLDESAHDWRYIRLGRSLGWTGVCLKTCKTQSGSLLSLCWARAHGMSLMVQDLTNPMLAQIPHVRLAAKADTIMGVETNAMQFYPEASVPEAFVHPGLYRRRHGELDLSTLGETGFGYRADEIARVLPAPAARFVS